MLSLCKHLEIRKEKALASCPSGVMKINVATAQYFPILAIKVCARLGCLYVGSQAKIVFHILDSV